ncbi:hypothetical protein STTU_0809 [Streptomyces sp. Tu6071]|uniref:Lsr2 dimerization domain-containing protein n=1 Tax=Streptomyces sp. Tu6071 TaxID=355249 RepID=UPI00020E5458|nr:histone-like nucleoid-structuring protein Lsr2 [Streptomyces sp. Tu6071]EGJ73598.1 hypothetical protein STTU_0809 [Streptomyces sp. Tu6071]
MALIRQSDLSDATGDEVSGFTLEIGGAVYDIDLTEKEYKEYLEFTGRYVAVARKREQPEQTQIPVARGAAAKKDQGDGYSAEFKQAVRAWALETGAEVDGKPISERGRIGAGFIRQYEAHMRAEAAKADEAAGEEEETQDA